MKKLASIILALSVLTACGGDRSHTLKVYNWSCYIDEDLIGEFEDWYEEQTGEKVKVIYQTFDVNETMLSKIELGHEDYDVVCPSDYIIERMLKNDMLLPIDRDFGDTPDYTSNISPFITNYFNLIDGGGKNANEYSIGYMWGTCGLLYNPKYVPTEDTKSWDVLCNPDNFGKILMKDAFRDVYTSLLIALNHDQLTSGEKDIRTLPFDSSNESIAMVEEYMNKFREGIAGWEADFGKEQMTKEQAWLSFNWSGDAQWAIDEAGKVGVKLDWSIPETGSTVWFDGWVIPKYAQNVKAARYFINFMCMPENAIRNMDEIGYVSVVAGDTVLEAAIDTTAYAPIDASYFFGENADSVCISPVQYPDRHIVESLAMMHDSDRTDKLLQMWSRIKGDNATNYTYIILGIAVVAIVAVAIARNQSKKKRHAKRR